jgi:hypothetical protein
MIKTCDLALVHNARGGANLRRSLEDGIEGSCLPAGEHFHQKYGSDGGEHDEAYKQAEFEQGGSGLVFAEAQKAMHENLHCESPRNVRMKPETLPMKV